MDKKLVTLKKEAKRFYQKADPAHDFSHIERVYKLSEKIGKVEKADFEILLPAVLLHDLKKPVKKSLPLARRILQKAKYSNKKIPKVLHAIEAHSFSNKIKPRTLEAKILSDADKLDAIGAIGIARTFAFDGAHGVPLYSMKDPFAKKRRLRGNEIGVDHFYTKLLKLKGMLYTKAAKRIARQRHRFMIKFLNELKSEI